MTWARVQRANARQIGQQPRVGVCCGLLGDHRVERVDAGLQGTHDCDLGTGCAVAIAYVREGADVLMDDLGQALDAATLRPARLLGRTTPIVEAGEPADLILFRLPAQVEEGRFELIATCVGGDWSLPEIANL